MRARRLAVTAAVAVIALAGCSGGGNEESAGSPVAQGSPAAQVETATESETAPRTPDPDAPENALLADGDDMGHKMCELWTTALDDENDLRDVADDVTWYGSQASNDFMQSPAVTYEWGADAPSYTTTLCKWNGYKAEEGSPADLLD